MMKLSLIGKQLQFSVLGIILYLLLLSLLCSLGFWQLGRAEQKQQLLLQQQAAASAPALNLNSHLIDDLDRDRYHKVIVNGHYDQEHQILIDNQVMEGKNGYWVLTPFFIKQQNKAVLVNRGWVAMGGDRKQLPEVGFAAEQLEIVGRINHLPSVGIKLKGMDQPSAGWPSVVQIADANVLAAKLGYEIYDFQVELDPEAGHGFRREWKTTVAIPPEKHQAYAVQWFGLALALSFLFVWISIQKTQ
jgi:surfeit locus 1 family protein